MDENRKRTTDIDEWDQKFITVDQEMLFEITLATNYLDIKPLLCAVLAAHASQAQFSDTIMQRYGVQNSRHYDKGKNP